MVRSARGEFRRNSFDAEWDGDRNRFTSKQQSFLNFVLAHYVGEGVDELDQEKLTPLLHLKYFNSTSDAIADLGQPEEIRRVFVDFQKYLYQPGCMNPNSLCL